MKSRSMIVIRPYLLVFKFKKLVNDIFSKRTDERKAWWGDILVTPWVRLLKKDYVFGKYESFYKHHYNPFKYN